MKTSRFLHLAYRRGRSAACGNDPPTKVVRRGSSRKRWIALTFDEITSQDEALATITALQAAGAPATIFLTGASIRDFPLVVARIAAAPLLEVGDHSMTHACLKELSTEELDREIGLVSDMFRRATGENARPLFRPPFGSLDARVVETARNHHFPLVVLWSIDPHDWEGRSASDIEQRVVDEAHRGAVVLMHLSAPGTAEALPGMIARLREQEYQLVTVSRMFKGEYLRARFAPDALLARSVRLLGLGATERNSSTNPTAGREA